jgi:MFS family permease
VSRWSAATGGFLTQVILFTGSSTLPLLLLAFEEALGLSSADAGLIISVYGIFYVIGAPVWGAISDRVGLQKALTSSSLIVSVGIFAMGAVNSLMACLPVYALIGFGSVALVVQIPKLL